MVSSSMSFSHFHLLGIISLLLSGVFLCDFVLTAVCYDRREGTSSSASPSSS